MTKKTAKKTKVKRGIVNSYEVTIRPWNGIVTSQDPYTIPEDVAVWINGLPKLTGSIETVKSPLLLYNHDKNIKDYFTFNLQEEQYHCIVDGENIILKNSTWQTVSSHATTSIIFDYAIQDNSWIWMCNRDRLLTFNGSNLYNLTNLNIRGDCICYWKGRIFIAKDRTITFSVPNPDPTGTNNPFNTSQGAGSITISVSDFSKILALVPKEDSIYLFTDRSIISIIGTTISNDPTQWYITEIVKEVGITGVKKYTRFEHTIYFHSNLGIYRIVATAPEKIDDAITNVTDAIQSISTAYYNQVPYVVVSARNYINSTTTALYLYNLIFKKWYSLEIQASNLCNLKGNTYFANTNKIYKLFSASTYEPLKIYSKTYYNTDNLYLNIKDLIVYGRGMSRYQSDTFEETFQVGMSNIALQNTNNIFFQTSSEINLVYHATVDFWINRFKPRSTIYSKRYEEFSFKLWQTVEGYSEIILMKARGTVGARYV